MPPPSLTRRRAERLTAEERSASDALLRRRVAERVWYHRMDLGEGIVTPGFPWESTWDNLRAVREGVDYRDASVLDLGSWDGMWAFEAEALGAALVVATDCMNTWQVPWYRGLENLLLVREALFSDVVPYWNVSLTDVRARLDAILPSHPRLRDGFNVVQHLGVLYHLRDPLLSLAQARSVLRDGGVLLLETAVHGTDSASVMHYNSGQSAVYEDFTTWWAPSIPCLRDMLRDSLFDVEEERVLPCGTPEKPIHRIALRARAASPRGTFGERYLLDPAYGHGFGEALVRRVPQEDARGRGSLGAYYTSIVNPGRELP